CHSYVDYLFAVVTMQSFEEALAAAYGSSIAMAEAWSRIPLSDPVKPEWREVIAIWHGEAFSNWLRTLEKALDAIPKNPSATMQEAIRETFRFAIRYQLQFMDMAV